jgi:hypothetical protein
MKAAETREAKRKREDVENVTTAVERQRLSAGQAVQRQPLGILSNYPSSPPPVSRMKSEPPDSPTPSVTQSPSTPSKTNDSAKATRFKTKQKQEIEESMDAFINAGSGRPGRMACRRAVMDAYFANDKSGAVFSCP